MAYVADILEIGDALVEIIQDDEAMVVIGNAVKAWLFVVRVPDQDCCAFATRAYWGAFDGPELLRDATEAGEAANIAYQLRRVGT